MPDLPLDILGCDREELVAFFKQQQCPAFHAQQVMQWMHQRGQIDFTAMTNLSKKVQAMLSQMSTFAQLPTVASFHQSTDGTKKWLLKLHDGHCIETVLIPERARATLCVSSQVGCALKCSFCATGFYGFKRHLSAQEIIAQLWLVMHRLQVDDPQPIMPTNVVFMGMGEPLHNLDAVLKAIHLMLSDYAYGLSKYRVTVSTSGLVPAMLKLKEATDASLAISLHAPNNEDRNHLVPINRKYPLEQLLPVCRDYFSKASRRKVTMEYVMLRNVNDSLRHAKQLIRQLQGIPCKVNLIPFNTFSASSHQPSTPESIKVFKEALTKAGYVCTVRKQRGDDIAGACGQLVAGQDR